MQPRDGSTAPIDPAPADCTQEPGLPTLAELLHRAQQLKEQIAQHTSRISPYPWRDAPRPVPDCADCTELVRQRALAQQRYDGSAESDCNVLLRRHLREAHL